jgi:hypothetical protein
MTDTRIRLFLQTPALVAGFLCSLVPKDNMLAYGMSLLF